LLLPTEAFGLRRLGGNVLSFSVPALTGVIMQSVICGFFDPDDYGDFFTFSLTLEGVILTISCWRPVRGQEVA
jgi:hypothetical protein